VACTTLSSPQQHSRQQLGAHVAGQGLDVPQQQGHPSAFMPANLPALPTADTLDLMFAMGSADFDPLRRPCC